MSKEFSLVNAIPNTSIIFGKVDVNVTFFKNDGVRWDTKTSIPSKEWANLPPHLRGMKFDFNIDRNDFGEGPYQKSIFVQFGTRTTPDKNKLEKDLGVFFGDADLGSMIEELDGKYVSVKEDQDGKYTSLRFVNRYDSLGEAKEEYDNLFNVVLDGEMKVELEKPPGVSGEVWSALLSAASSDPEVDAEQLAKDYEVSTEIAEEAVKQAIGAEIAF